MDILSQKKNLGTFTYTDIEPDSHITSANNNIFYIL